MSTEKAYAVVHEYLHAYDAGTTAAWTATPGRRPKDHADPAHWYVDRVFETGHLEAPPSTNSR